jgi:hypothetical protein
MKKLKFKRAGASLADIRNQAAKLGLRCDMSADVYGCAFVADGWITSGEVDCHGWREGDHEEITEQEFMDMKELPKARSHGAERHGK